MDINQLEAIVKQGESYCLELKTSTSQLKPAFETICSFLNGNGGMVLIGVKNDGKIIGQDVTDNTRQEIAREIKKIEPAGQVEVSYIPVNNNKHVIALEVYFGRYAPYTYDGRSYERIESSTSLMSQHRYEQLLIRRGQLNHAWEEQITEHLSINSLDQEEIHRMIQEGVDKNRIGIEVLNYDVQHILNALKLSRDGKLINAAAVLFAKDVMPDFSNCMMRMARFRGTDNLGDFIDNQRVYGNAFRLISLANDFVMRHLPIASFFEEGKMQRIDQPAVPALALREALVNAISHRDYSNRSASIALAIFDDRLEIWNNGELPPELKIEDLKKPHQSYPRNEEIATIFYKRGWVEGWGTGTLRMISYCQKNRTPEPEFKEYSGGFSVTFRFKESMSSEIKKIPEISTIELTARQKEILDILKAADEMAIKNIMQNLTSPPAERTLRDELGRLRDKGLVGSRGRAKNAVWFLVKK